jgi:hypothetical protein
VLEARRGERNKFARLTQDAIRDWRSGLGSGARLLMLKRIFLACAIVGIALAHGVILYKIDTGIRSNNVTPVAASRSQMAFW